MPRKSPIAISATKARRFRKAATCSAASASCGGCPKCHWPTPSPFPPSPERRSPETRMAKFDLNDDGVVVIIGSGAGGGTLAHELTRRGIKVVLIEAGKRESLATFSQ